MDDSNYEEPDSDQLSAEDQLLDRHVDDLLDEGMSVPEYAPPDRYGDTDLEESEGEDIDQRRRQEEPEIWSPDYQPVDTDRAGRLAPVDDYDPDADGDSSDVYAEDVGVDGGGAGVEEAAVHIIDDEDLLSSDDDE